jgi:hypothetical protein
VQTYFWRKYLFWERHNFGERATGGNKVACKKRRKINMQEEMQRGAQAGRPNHDRFRVVDKDCNGYKHVE